MNIILLRDEFNLTQKDVSDYLDMGRSNYCWVESGELKKTKIEAIVKLGFLYNVSLNYILDITNEKGVFEIDIYNNFIKEYKIDINIVEKLRLKKHKYDYDYSEGSKK